MRKAGLLASTVQICKIHDVVDFFTQHVTEWNVNYDDKGDELVNTVAARVNQDAPHTASWTVQEMLDLLADGKDRERHGANARLPLPRSHRTTKSVTALCAPSQGNNKHVLLCERLPSGPCQPAH